MLKTLLESKVEAIYDCLFLYLKETSKTVGLLDGELGIILFLIHYLEYKKINNEDTEGLISERIQNFTMSFKTHSFCSGLSGGLFLFEILKENNVLEIESEEIEHQINVYLSSKLNVEIAENHYDFLHGALGTGFYYVKIGNIQGISKIINYLEETVDIDPNDCYKWKSNNVYSGETIYNISLSHGISSIIIFLCKVLNEVSVGNTKLASRIEVLLRGAVNYVLSQEIDLNTYGSSFPNRSKEFIAKSRLAWCYGDLGIGIALWHTSKILNDSSLKNKALKLLLESTKRNLSTDSDIIEGGICHGTSGLAMIYYRMYLETNIDEFYSAYEYWLRKTLDFSYHEEGAAGYLSYINNEWQKDYNLISGISGIGLVALSYLKKDNQYWDEIFLLH